MIISRTQSILTQVISSDEQYSERYMRCRQLVKPLSHQGPDSIQTQISKHLLIKNRDTCT
jgi:hypothetical protein